MPCKDYKDKEVGKYFFITRIRRSLARPVYSLHQLDTKQNPTVIIQSCMVLVTNRVEFHWAKYVAQTASFISPNGHEIVQTVDSFHHEEFFHIIVPTLHHITVLLELILKVDGSRLVKKSAAMMSSNLLPLIISYNQKGSPPSLYGLDNKQSFFL